MHKHLLSAVGLKTHKKINFLPTILVALLLLVSIPAFSQPGFDDDVDDEIDPAPASIDANLLLLLSAGVITGIYFIRKKETANH